MMTDKKVLIFLAAGLGLSLAACSASTPDTAPAPPSTTASAAATSTSTPRHRQARLLLQRPLHQRNQPSLQHCPQLSLGTLRGTRQC